MIEGARAAGALLMQYRGRPIQSHVKENQASIVTEADFASEELLTELIRRRFPDHGILGEEGGHLHAGREFTWILDPLDGTSNFAAGLPWFGVMIGVLQGTRPVLGCLYLPVEDRLYVAVRGGGATCNGQPIRVHAGADMSSVLCACAMDASRGQARNQWQARLLAEMVWRARNVRATNSLFDFAATADGRLGACVNFSMKLWDLAAPWILMEEAGGVITDLQGGPIEVDLGPQACTRSYPVVAGGPALVPQILEMIRHLGPPPESGT